MWRLCTRRQSVVAALTHTTPLCAMSSSTQPPSSPFPLHNGGTEGWSMPRGHHLNASVGRHSVVHTACGRTFDPNTYQDMLQACCDQNWLQAVQRTLVEDKEYVEMLRTEGGAAKIVQEMSQNINHDDEFMEKLKERLKTDRKVALSLCALQESYLKIRRKRDEHETQSAADGNDPYSALKRQRVSFGQDTTNM